MTRVLDTSPESTPDPPVNWTMEKKDTEPEGVGIPEMSGPREEKV